VSQSGTASERDAALLLPPRAVIRFEAIEVPPCGVRSHTALNPPRWR
jgi:hypothetical protein